MFAMKLAWTWILLGSVDLHEQVYYQNRKLIVLYPTNTIGNT